MGNDISIFKDDESRTDSDGDDESYEDDSEEELERRQRKPEYSYKLVIVGRPESGKTALINRFIKGTFTEAFQSETRDVLTKQVAVTENLNVTLHIWDILPRASYLTWFDGAEGAIVVYDSGMPSELDALKWKQELDGISKERPIPIALVATKCDEKHTKDPQLDKFVTDYGFIGRYDTSAKLDTNVTQVFSELIQHMLANDPKVLRKHKPDLGEPVPVPEKAPPSPLIVPVQTPPPNISPPLSHSTAPPAPTSLTTSSHHSSYPSSTLPHMQSEASVVHDIPDKMIEKLEKKADDIFNTSI